MFSCHRVSKFRGFVLRVDSESDMANDFVGQYESPTRVRVPRRQYTLCHKLLRVLSSIRLGNREVARPLWIGLVVEHVLDVFKFVWPQQKAFGAQFDVV